ncbi:MAG TPA: segregation/condensation protein A, partial [Candidatus Agathobaculum pullicola]|nr:segregation/condensation protein A [Candidatus Agathobaculum pullicola]
EDPRTSLVEMLLEYQRIKETASFFREKGEMGRDIFVKPPELLGDAPREYRQSITDLIRAANNMLRRAQRRVPPPASAFSGIVGREPVPVEGRITSILKRFLHHVRVPFRRLFDDATSRSEIVATFLAVLELSKNRRIRLEGDGEDMELTLIDDKGE